MARKRCGHVGRIASRVKTGNINCCKTKRAVIIVVSPDGNYCDEKTCPHNGILVTQVTDFR